MTKFDLPGQCLVIQCLATNCIHIETTVPSVPCMNCSSQRDLFQGDGVNLVIKITRRVGKVANRSKLCLFVVSCCVLLHCVVTLV